jgi:hypothetical protein
MATGVNMHTCCCRGIFMNWFMNAKGMLPIIYRLIRINQRKAVKFHPLKSIRQHRTHLHHEVGKPAVCRIDASWLDE